MKEHGFGEFNPKAVLFDMDGVLYNSMPNHAVAWQESMKQFDIHMTAADAYATEGARGIDTIQMMVKKQKGIDITLDEAQKMYDVKTEIFHSMPLYATSSLNFTTLLSGGSSSMVRARVRTRRVSSQQLATSLPTFTLWASGFSRASALSSRLLSA